MQLINWHFVIMQASWKAAGSNNLYTLKWGSARPTAGLPGANRAACFEWKKG